MTPPATTDELGAHVSAAGGVRNAPARAAALGAVVLQLFTKQPSRWAEPSLDDDETTAFRNETLHHGIRAAASHDSYLINLATPDPVLHARSLHAFRCELERCRRLGIDTVVTHPGHAIDGDVPSAIHRNADAITAALELVPGIHALLETTAGAGRALGASFEELAAILRRIPDPLQHRLGICLDTCHVWAAGYDLRHHYADVMSRIDDTIGLHRVRLFHLNDSVAPLASRRDRHTHIGHGALGDDAFRSLLRDERFLTVPKLLETPKGDDGDATAADLRNLARLRALRAGTL